MAVEPSCQSVIFVTAFRVVGVTFRSLHKLELLKSLIGTSKSGSGVSQ
jgi:hypothetical protein